MPALHARKPDILVIGGGIVGLWTGFFAARQGLTVTLIDKRPIGSGASGGVLGALMPHQPTGWDGKKQFQLNGLISLQSEIEVLEAATGVDAGYHRCGRVMPIRAEHRRAHAQNWAEASKTAWPEPWKWELVDRSPRPQWLPDPVMPFGANVDTLSARVDPRKLIAALRAGLDMSTVTIIEYCAAVSIAGNGSVQTSDGDVFKPGATIVAAGWESFALLESCLGPDCGTGVKGQAALLRPSEAVDPLSPIIYDDGVYAITHGNGLVAVGSTSENDFSDPFSTDGKLDDLIAKAARACPALTESQIIERWAGIRPKASGRDPLVGRLPGTASTIIATGGFKITFGIAHLMAKAALALAASEEPAFLPASFRPENRLRPRSG